MIQAVAALPCLGQFSVAVERGDLNAGGRDVCGYPGAVNKWDECLDSLPVRALSSAIMCLRTTGPEPGKGASNLQVRSPGDSDQLSHEFL